MSVTLVILAGGRSERLGEDKALVPLAREPLLRRTARRLLGVPGAVEIVVACGSRDRADAYAAALAPFPLPARVVPDAAPARGPLAGLAAAAAAASGARLAVAPVDAPFLDAAAYATLLAAARGRDGAVPRSAGGLEPLHGVYARAPAAGAFARALARGGGSPRDAFPDLDLVVLDPGVADAHYAGVNTPDELTAVRAALRGG